MLAKFTSWLFGLFKAVLTALLDVLKDAFVAIAQVVLTAFSDVVSAIPAPSFLSQYSLSSLISQLPSDVLFFAGQLKLGQAFVILAAGFTFRMARKILTLGQW